MATEIVCDGFTCKRVAKKPAKIERDEVTGELKIDKGFGSFFTENVEVLVSLSESDYKTPDIPVSVEFKDLDDGPIEFGRGLRDKYFCLSPDWTFINHGAFGAALKPAIEAAHQWAVHTERQPLTFLDRQLLPILVHTTRQVAAFVKCPAPDCILLPNVTTALNAIFRSMNFQKDDNVLILSVAYSAVHKMLDFYCQSSGASIVELKVEFPLLDRAHIVDLVRSYFQGIVDKKKNNESNNDDNKDDTTTSPSLPQLAVFDHITSNEALVLPIAELIKVCNEFKVPVCIDGAHALGALDLNISELKPTFYVSNAHKWLCSPKGCAFMYVDPAYQATIKPLAISHGHGSGFFSDFIWSGLRDYGPLLSLMTVLDFWNKVGPTRIREYATGLARWAANHLCAKWQTNTLFDNTDPADPEQEKEKEKGGFYNTMITIRLPGPEYAQKPDEHNTLQDVLHFNHNIEVPVKNIENRLYVRISAHMYNSKEEYELLGDVMLQLRPNTNINTNTNTQEDNGINNNNDSKEDI